MNMLHADEAMLNFESPLVAQLERFFEHIEEPL